MTRWLATVSTPTRHVRMVIEQVGTSTYEFEVFSADGVYGTILEHISSGTTKGVAQAIASAENDAMEYLASEREKATVPFWLEEEVQVSKQSRHANLLSSDSVFATPLVLPSIQNER